MQLSKNASGIALLLVSVLGLFGVEVELDTALDFVLAIIGVISFFLMVWNQIDRPDVSGFFFKK